MSLSMVLSSAELHAALHQSGLRCIDLRPADAFQHGHIPGAVHVDAALLNRQAPPVVGLLPDAEQVNRLLREGGVQAGDHVVAIDAGASTQAARLVWVLNAYGIESVSWLDGGMAAWQAAGLEQTQSDANGDASQHNTLTVDGSPQYVIDANELLQRLDDDDLAILDVRSAEEFAGSDIRSAHGGHVPGAVHSNWTGLFGANGQLKSPEVLQAELDTLGISKDKTVVVYCQSHQRSSVTYVALRHLGYDKVVALDGAWSNWGNRPDLPKETLS